MSTSIADAGPVAVGLDGPPDRVVRELRYLYVVLITVLVAFGIQMVHSASVSTMPGRGDARFLLRHLISIAVGGTAACVATTLKPATLQRFIRPLFLILLILLAAVLLPGTGSRVNGASRWLRLGPLSLQPSELGRLLLPVLATTLLFELKRTGPLRMRSLPAILLPLAIIVPLVLAEPDLGASVFLTVGYVLPFFIGGWPLLHFAGGLLLLVPVAGFLLILRPYQLERITGFFSAWQDLNSAPWQIRQSLLSLGSGGLHGRGIGEGWQKLSYLPEANTDFVFAVIGEELGLIGTLTICILWAGVFLTGSAALSHLPRRSFAWILGMTLHLQLVLQALANIAVVTAMVPPKGVPHPFISYGGTNLTVSLTAVGLIVAMSRCDASAAAMPEPTADPRLDDNTDAD